MNYKDGYIDNRVLKWCDVKGEIMKLKNIKRVCFTRKSFSDIPQMKIKIDGVQKFCLENKIAFQFLVTPARFYRNDKQTDWTNFLLL